MKENTKYWKGVEELNETPEFLESAKNEFPEYLPVKEQRSTKDSDEEEPSRRDFLKLMGFSVAAASLAACETPVKKAIPYVNKPEEIDPGVPNYYASSFVSGGEYASVLVKTREGRPIFIEPNKESSISGAGLSPRAVASVLDLYDNSRLRSFKKNGEDISIKKADKEIKAGLKAAKKIRIVSPTIISPSALQLIEDFKKKYAGSDVQLIQFDPISYKGLAKANGGVIPSYDFSKADVIVSFTADFCGTWVSGTEYSSQYAETRRVSKEKKTMSRHYQFESILSTTGASADERIGIKPSEEALAIISLYNKVTGASIDTKGLPKGIEASVAAAAKELKAAKGKSLVVSGSNDVKLQQFVREINAALGNEGTTVDLKNGTLVRASGDELALAQFASDALQGKVDAVILLNSNVVYHYFGCSDSMKEAFKSSEQHKNDIFKNIKTKIAITDREDETASLEGFYIASSQNWLECWGDAQPKEGYFSLQQPTITPLFKGTRAAEESLMAWAGVSGTYYDYVKAYWEKNLFPMQSQEILFGGFWNKTLQKGVFEPGKKLGTTPEPVAASNDSTLVSEQVAEEQAPLEEAVVPVAAPVSFSASAVASKIAQDKRYKKVAAGNVELVAYECGQMGDGSGANNPWLQEMPDSISKVTWDNYLAISAYDAETDFGKLPRDSNNPTFKQGDVAKVVAPGLLKLEIPVLIQPGQAPGTVGLALGYGRTKAGKLAAGIENKVTEDAIGVSAFPFVNIQDGTLSYSVEVEVSKTANTYKFAQTQTHHTIMGRDIVQGTYLSDYKEGNTGKVDKQFETSKGKVKPSEIDLWKPQTEETHIHPIHKWGLSIDLNTCTGCSACHIACQSENNIPVVGKDEVARRRDMHWLRIDRYYSSDMDLDKAQETGVGKIGGLTLMEKPEDNPKVTFMPMMCQHCNHAPCETVCPVSATNHSSEGLNQMAYNRCIGTRYCANNCPYKVRRFNWFNYSDKPWSEREFSKVNTAMNDDLGRMVLNPDVTVRARGVMEKCSMCVQRIQAGKLQAKREKRPVTDQDVSPACVTACATGAIKFGDTNNAKSEIAKERGELNGDRTYEVLEELNVQPGVTYLTKIRNEKTNDKKIKF